MKKITLFFLFAFGAVAFVNAQTPTTKSHITLTFSSADTSITFEYLPNGGESPYLCDTVLYPSDAKKTTYTFAYKLDWYGSIAGESEKVVHYTAKSGNGLYIFTNKGTYHIPLNDAVVTASTWRKTYAWINVGEIKDTKDYIEFQYEQYDSEKNPLFDPNDIASIKKLATAIGAKLER